MSTTFAVGLRGCRRSWTSGGAGCLRPMRQSRSGRGGVTAVAATTGIARSTINRGVAELRAARNEIGRGIRRPGAGRKRETERQPGLLSALEALIEDAIRGDPEAPLRWVSRSQRNIAETLRRQGFQVSQKLIGQSLRANESETS